MGTEIDVAYPFATQWHSKTGPFSSYTDGKVPYMYPSYLAAPLLIRQTCQQLGISEGGLAELLGLPMMSRRIIMSQWKHGVQRPSPRYLCRAWYLMLIIMAGCKVKKDAKTRRLLLQTKDGQLMKLDWEKLSA